MDVTQSLIVGALGLLTSVMLAGLVCIFRRQAKQLADLQAKLEIFVDSSINVARSVDRVVNRASDSDTVVPIASRRNLVQEARARIAQGDDLLGTARTLNLSGDETRLLRARVGLS